MAVKRRKKTKIRTGIRKRDGSGKGKGNRKPKTCKRGKR